MLYPNTFNKRKSLTPRRHRPVITPPVRFVKSSNIITIIECDNKKGIIDFSNLNSLLNETLRKDVEFTKVVNNADVFVKEFEYILGHKYTVTAFVDADYTYMSFTFKEKDNSAIRRMKISKKSRFYKP